MKNLPIHRVIVARHRENSPFRFREGFFVSMRKQVRTGVFETNSSSTHSICVAKGATTSLPKSIRFEIGAFGWEHSTLRSLSDKASYLYTGLLANNQTHRVKKMLSWLKKDGIEVYAQEPKMQEYSLSDGSKGAYLDNGYVDHSDQLGPFLAHVMSSKENLYQFLFSPLSYILTGNDNDEYSDISIDESYPHDKFYKGN